MAVVMMMWMVVVVFVWPLRRHGEWEGHLKSRGVGDRCEGAGGGFVRIGPCAFDAQGE